MATVKVSLLPISFDVHIITTSELKDLRTVGTPAKLTVREIIMKPHRGRFELESEAELYDGHAPYPCVASWHMDPADVTIPILFT